MLCVVWERSVRRADHSSRGVLPSVVCLNMILKPQQRDGLCPLGVLSPKHKLSCTFYSVLLFWNFVFEMSVRGPGVITADFLNFTPANSGSIPHACRRCFFPYFFQSLTCLLIVVSFALYNDKCCKRSLNNYKYTLCICLTIYSIY